MSRTFARRIRLARKQALYHRFRWLHLERLEDRVVLDATNNFWAGIPEALVPTEGMSHEEEHLPVLLQQYQLFNSDGYLTGPAAGQPDEIALDYLRSRAADLGVAPEDFDHVDVWTNYVTETTGITHLSIRQMLNGLEIDNANFNVNVAADGRILNVGGGFVADVNRFAADFVAPKMDALTAVAMAARSLDVIPTSDLQFVQIPEGLSHSSIVSASGVSLEDIPARLEYVATPDGDVQLSWTLIVQTTDGAHWYDLHIGADYGAVISTHDFAHAHATYNVFAMPLASPDEGGLSVQTNPDIILPTPAVAPSPFGWHDTNGVAGAEFTITRGNNVNAYTDIDANNVIDVGSQPDGGAGLNFSFPLDLTQQPSTYRPAAVTNLFYWNNILHDVHYLYGFNEAARNFQANNYGRGGLGNDAVNAEAQDGSGTNNANFATPADGSAPRMQMFLWNQTSPMRDGDFDNAIITHEYGHGVSNRLTGNGSGLGALQSGGMGEGWSDWWSLMFTQKTAGETTVGRGVGTYVLGQPTTGLGIRQYRYDFDIGNVALETFANFGTGAGQSTAVHAAGTRWASALWDINHLLIQKYGYNSNIYDSTSSAGNIEALHLVLNGLKLQLLNPTFLNARDAILAADTALNGSANHLELWTAFARRGLGFSATTPNSSSSIFNEAYDLPPAFQQLSVVSTTPAVGSTVAVQPTSFVVNFTAPYLASSVQETDFTANGIPATGFSLTDADTVTFTYGVSPVVVEGLQTMAIAANQILKASDSSDNLAFSGQFRYDVLSLAVTTTVPPAGGVFTLPGPFTYDVNFNEPVAPGSVTTDDLTLSAGTVTGAVPLDADTARYTISGITTEATLNITLAAGKVTDTFGNANPAPFSASYSVDIGTVPYPVPLASKAPAGSLIYDPSISGVINFPGDTDQFTLNIDPGQTITVLVDPAGSPDPSLYGGVGNGAGAAAGQLLLINQATAASTIVGDPVTPGGLTGLVFDPSSGVFYGTTIQSLANASALVRIDPNSGALLSAVGTIRVGSAGGPTIPIGDLAIQPGTDVLYAVRSNSGSSGFGELYTIDKTTAIATLIGSTGSGSGGGLAFAPDGSLYQTAHNSGFDFTSLNKINPATAARISTVAISSYFDGLAIRPTDGVFYGAQGGSGSAIHTINPITGAITLIGNTSATTSDLAFRPSTALAPTIELRDPANAVIGSISAGTGLNALLQTVATTTGGAYSITVSSVGGTTGGYTVQVVLNAALEEEGKVAGATNNTLGAAQNIDGIGGSFLNLDTTLAHAQRGAVLGTTDAASGYTAAAVTPTFQDISTTGTRSSSAVGDDSSDTLSAAQLAGFTFPFFGTTNTTLSFSTNALITFGGANASFSNGDLSTSPAQAAIAALWDDLNIDNTGTGTASRAIFWQVIGSGASQQLIIQWNNVRRLGGSTYFTLQAVLSKDGAIQLNYAPTVVSSVVTSATVGVKAAGTSNPQRQLLHFNQSAGPLVGPNLSTRLTPVVPQPDYYSFSLGSGETATVAVTGQAAGNLNLELRDGSDATLATGVGGATNLTKVISNFTGAAGTYYVRVSGDGNVPYSVMVTKNAAFDTEGNNSFGAAQNINGTQGALGAITAAVGTAINATDSGWLASDGTHITTNNNYFVGQALFNGNPTATLRNYSTFSVSAATPTIVGAELRLFNPGAPNLGYTSPDPTETYTLFDVFATAAALDTERGAGDATGIAIHADLGSGTVFGSRVVSAADNGTTVAITLNAAGVAALNAAIGSSISFGGALTTLAGTAQQSMFGFTTGAAGTVQLVLQTGEDDWYAVNVASVGSQLRFETRTPADGPGQFVNTLNPRIELYRPDGTLLTSGVTLTDGRNEYLQVLDAPVAGTYRVRVSGEGNTVGEYFLGMTVGNTPPVVTNGLASQTKQYSDPIAPVTISATDVIGETLTASTTFTFNGGIAQAGLPTGLILTANGLQSSAAGFDTHTWTLSGIADVAPGAYVVTVTITDSEGGTGSTNVTLVVTQEDARATYTGAFLVSTSSVNDDTAFVPLQATVRDITAVSGDPNHDPSAGVITNAKATFKIYDDAANTLLATIADVAVNLIDPAETKIGAAIANWEADLGNSDSKTYRVEVLVTHYYANGAQADEADTALVTVSRPLPNFITGGGYLLPSTSAGAYAGDAGSKAQFGLNVKFNQRGTNLQGNVNIRFVHDGRLYQIKSNSLQSLVANPLTGHAEVVTKANLKDVTDPSAPISIGGNLTLHLVMTDNGEPGSGDTLSITLSNDSGQLFYSSHWNGVQTLEQLLARGNLQVHSSASFLQASGEFMGNGGGEDFLALQSTESLFQQAIAFWHSQGVDGASLEEVSGMSYYIVDLPGSYLGMASPGAIWLDQDAAGYGWSRVDVGTVVAHEIGHLLGFEHSDEGVMASTLFVGATHGATPSAVTPFSINFEQLGTWVGAALDWGSPPVRDESLFRAIRDAWEFDGDIIRALRESWLSNNFMPLLLPDDQRLGEFDELSDRDRTKLLDLLFAENVPSDLAALDLFATERDS